MPILSQTRKIHNMQQKTILVTFINNYWNSLSFTTKNIRRKGNKDCCRRKNSKNINNIQSKGNPKIYIKESLIEVINYLVMKLLRKSKYNTKKRKYSFSLIQFQLVMFPFNQSKRYYKKQDYQIKTQTSHSKNQVSQYKTAYKMLQSQVRNFLIETVYQIRKTFVFHSQNSLHRIPQVLRLIRMERQSAPTNMTQAKQFKSQTKNDKKHLSFQMIIIINRFQIKCCSLLKKLQIPMKPKTQPKENKPPSFGNMDLSFTNINDDAILPLFNQSFNQNHPNFPQNGKGFHQTSPIFGGQQIMNIDKQKQEHDFINGLNIISPNLAFTPCLNNPKSPFNLLLSNQNRQMQKLPTQLKKKEALDFNKIYDYEVQKLKKKIHLEQQRNYNIEQSKQFLPIMQRREFDPYQNIIPKIFTGGNVKQKSPQKLRFSPLLITTPKQKDFTSFFNFDVNQK